MFVAVLDKIKDEVFATVAFVSSGKASTSFDRITFFSVGTDKV